MSELTRSGFKVIAPTARDGVIQLHPVRSAAEIAQMRRGPDAGPQQMRRRVDRTR